ncbi:peptidase M20 (plasmid) [Paraburkholderia sp. PGU19]|uniref:dipeptidase n=1 Tax=Paraburkholderia sp. PGU19 TaxID=2735434 RepID=UPI0015DA0B37|nr:dipeptidase [Paraburkholderia sp. PGU19]BCG02010.1 peptidase M20 [Paraburkholderia sp. PGU19]
MIDDVLRHARAQRARHVDELKRFIAFASVSAQPSHAVSLRRCAAWLAAHLRGIGLADAGVYATRGHPIVHASWRTAGSKPCLLIYGHYDVQPAEPLDQWRSPPFRPVVRGDALFGRGASDDKGQLFIFVKAIEAWLRERGRLPIDIVCLFEGEEEIGSPNLLPFVARHREALRCDGAVMADSAMANASRPALMHALRGALYLELDVRGPRHDLHSGNFGGVVLNPLQALCELLAGLHDARGRIAIPGFYDNVRTFTPHARERLLRDAPSDASIMRDAGIGRPWGEAGFSLYERLTVRPALTINGIQGGYAGAGSKGVIPAAARAKLSFRLVPDQDPREIEQIVRAHLSSRIAPAVCGRMRVVSAAPPAQMDTRHPVIVAATRACERAFGVQPALLRGGGTIPALQCFNTVLGTQTALLGFAPNDAGRHAPNEKLHLPTFEKAVAAAIALFDAFAAAHATSGPASRGAGRIAS